MGVQFTLGDFLPSTSGFQSQAVTHQAKDGMIVVLVHCPNDFYALNFLGMMP